MKRSLLLLISVLFLSACAMGLTKESIMKDSAAAMQFCAESPKDKQIDCYFFIADVLKTSDVQTAANACSLVPDEDDKQGCFMQTFEANNATNNRAIICKKIEDENYKKGCIEDTVKDEKDAKIAAELCNEIQNDNNFKEHCINLVMGSASDVDSKLAACEATKSDNCYENMAYEIYDSQPIKSVEICKKISETTKRNNCLNYFLGNPELIKANPTLAISICGEFTLKDNCYRNVAGTLSAVDGEKAVEVCKKMSDEIQITDCFGNVWFNFDSRVIQNFDFSMSMCKGLTLKKDDCYRRIADTIKNYDKAKAERACEMLSSTSASEGCVNNI